MLRCVWPFGVALVVGLVALFGAASAGEEESRTLFAQGRELCTQGKCADAILLFRESLEAYPEGLGAMRNIAECEEELRRYASARRTWWDLRLAVLKAGQARYEGWDKDAEQAHEKLAGRVAKLKVTIKEPVRGRVLVHGRPLDPRLLGVELEQDLGELEIVYEDGSAVPMKKTLVLEQGQSYTVDFESAPTSSEPDPDPGGGTTPPPPTGGKQPDEGSSGPSALLVGGAVAVAVGGASLGVMGAFIGVRQSALATIEEECPDLEGCPASLQDESDRGELASLMVNVFAGIGGAGVAAGAAMLIADAVGAGGPARPRAASRSSPPPPAAGGCSGWAARFDARGPSVDSDTLCVLGVVNL